MVRTAGKGSEAVNSRQGSGSSGGGRGRGRGGRGSGSPNSRAGGTRPSRASNDSPARPVGGYLNSLLGSTSRNTPPRDRPGPSSATSRIPPGSDKRGMEFLLAAVDHIDPGNFVGATTTTTATTADTGAATTTAVAHASTITFTSSVATGAPTTTFTSSVVASAATTSTAASAPTTTSTSSAAAAINAAPLAVLPEDGREMGRKIDDSAVTLPLPREANSATAIAASPTAHARVAPPNSEGEAAKKAVDPVVPPAADSDAPAPAAASHPDEEVEEGEIVDNGVEEGEEQKFIVPDLNLPPPPDEE